MVYVDASRPDLIERFTEQTFITMIEGVRDAAMPPVYDRAPVQRQYRDLRRATRADGVFCYTFFKGDGSFPPDLPRSPDLLNLLNLLHVAVRGNDAE